MNTIQNKNAQIHIMQTVFVLIIVFVILFIAFYGYMQYKKDTYIKETEDQKSKDTILVASYVLSTPELSCSQKKDVKQNCFDASKLLVFDSSSNLEYYADHYGFSNITVQVIYGNKSFGVCDGTSFPMCNYFVLYENVPESENSVPTNYYIPVSVYNPFEDSYYAAYALVSVYT